MQNRKIHVVVSALLIAALLTTSLSASAFAATGSTAPSAAAAQVTSSTVTGTLSGGSFAKIWLGFRANTPDTDVTLTITWDVDAPGSNGRHFYVLDDNNLATVVAGGSLQDNNIASSSPVFQGPGNQEYATFRAGSSSYTVVVSNDSSNDSTFTLTSTGGLFSDDSGQVVDPNATSTETAEAPAEEAAAEEVATEEATTEEAAVEATTEVTDTATVSETAVTTTTEAAEATATPAPAVAATTAVTEVRAAELEGALPEQYDQHFLGLVPDSRDAEVSLLLTFDPQDSQELARRLNFWVMDAEGLQRYVEGTNASELAIAAGNRTFTGDTNERVATFTAAGSGPYTVIVYNNSQVPATYKLIATGGILVDDSAQTTTAQNSGASVTTTTAAATTDAGAETATTTTTTTTTAATTSTGETGTPGGTHTVASGDTLAIIARDVYGDYTLYTQLCAFNNISDCNRIEVGQVIQLPTQEQLDSGAVAAVTPAATAAATTAATPAATTATTTTTTAAATPAATATAAATTAAALPTATTAASTTGAAASGSDIISALEANGNFTILLQALDAAGLTSQLEGAGSFTLFAPTDSAFTALGLADVNSLIRDTSLVENLLLYHMVDSEVSTEDITTGEELTTLQGSAIEFTVSGQNVKVQDSNIIVPDVAASNGVIQMIDKVMLPPQ